MEFAREREDIGSWVDERLSRIEDEKTADKEVDWWLLVKGRLFWQLLMFYLLCSETEEDRDTTTDHELGRVSISEKVLINV